ncbi:HAD family hydrolase [Nocardia sp. CNY236]|uniref:HAD-IIIC family phosphatase n=1 Tax=Nocardia sp. CNY236 TaxID=1169152 RepID=UPI000424E3FC|nr:HAD-IIIC family phosphatase [Nocardia sp. CNY236]
MSVDPADVLVSQRRWLARRRALPMEPTLRVGVSASFTAQPLETFLGAGLLDAGEEPAFAFADHNRIHQVCFDPDNTLGSVDLAVLLWRIEDMFTAALHRLLAEADNAAADSIVADSAHLGHVVGAFARTFHHPVLVGTPPTIAPLGLDLVDSSVTVDLDRVRAAACAAFLDALADSPARIVDLAAWERSLGLAHVHDPVKWITYRQPYTTRFWAVVGSHLTDAIVREKSPPPKCLVLDADNTLWGGVVGEVGLAGIELSSTFPGIAFQEFQWVLKRLHNRGVLLAVASKNTIDDVLDVFRHHDEMVLSPDDIAAWRVNWSPKSQNIREIAGELNVGEDALVLIDDSESELGEVRACLPRVRCLHVPEEIAELPLLLPTSGLFRNLRVSTEDRQRATMLRSERARKGATAGMTHEQFLASLELTVSYFAVEDQHVGRVTQLINKTNQFNLTTIRRTESDLRALIASGNHLVRGIRVSDRFGDYGLVGVVVLRRVDSSTWDIDTLLLSCRVLGRGLETAFIARIAADAGAAGAHRITARYIPTAKNTVVADLYPRHGFIDRGSGRFDATISAVSPVPPHITITR